MPIQESTDQKVRPRSLCNFLPSPTPGSVLHFAPEPIGLRWFRRKTRRLAMAGMTPFTIGADAICADGACGKLTGVVFDPVARAVTHLVVERHGLERLVPLDLADATRGEIRIR